MQALNVVIALDHASLTGGQAKVAFDSAIGLKARGHNPIIFAGVGPIDKGLTEAGVEVHCLGQSDLAGAASRASAAIQGIWNAPAAKALGALLSGLPRENTIVHVHGWAKALSPSIARPIAASGLPTVYTMHEFFLHCPNGGFYNHRAGENCELTPMSGACIATNCDSRHYAHKLWRVARQGVSQWIAHLPQGFSDIIYLCEFEREIIAPFTPANVRLHRVANPVDASPLGRKREPASGDVIFVGRLSAEKGAALYAEAAVAAGLTPVFIGEGPQETELKQHFPQGRFLGWRPHEEVRGAMRAARALVFPSLWYETFGLTVYEALALGTPVVVSDGSAGREAVQDGRNGFWFRRADAGDLAQKLVALRDDGLVARLSNEAYDSYWAAPFTLERHMEALLGVYRSLLGLPASRMRRAPRQVA
jgi:glycosyltransferase involved in cell wall biosynthesis